MPQHRRIQIVAALVAALLLAAALPAAANDTTLNVNVNPPRQLSDPAMPVRMAAETITVHFGRERCAVAIEFTFENNSEQDAWLTAGFPDEDLLYRYAFYGAAASDSDSGPAAYFPQFDMLGDNPASGIDDQSVLTDFRAWTRPEGSAPEAAAALETRLLRIERIAWVPEALDSLGGQWHPAEDGALNELMFCRAFDLHLAPHERLIVGHSYSTLSGGNVEGQALFNYTLATGRTWGGSIGEARIELFLEDGLSRADLNFEGGEPGYGATCNPGAGEWSELEPGHLECVWRDFEPEGSRSYIMLASRPVPPPPQP